MEEWAGGGKDAGEGASIYADEHEQSGIGVLSRQGKYDEAERLSTSIKHGQD